MHEGARAVVQIPVEGLRLRHALGGLEPEGHDAADVAGEADEAQAAPHEAELPRLLHDADEVAARPEKAMTFARLARACSWKAEKSVVFGNG
jgi:hypothetical protein